jgi:hypothetical protein
MPDARGAGDNIVADTSGAISITSYSLGGATRPTGRRDVFG